MLKIGHIDFVNMIPLEMEKSTNFVNIRSIPTKVNEMLLRGEVDIGVISSSFFLQNRNHLRRIGNLGIVADGLAMSVILLSKRDFSDQCNRGSVKIYETPKSATSILMNRIILNRTYKLDVISAENRSDAEAVLLIGDEALLEQGSEDWPYMYDLGEEWKNLTGLPAVFAVLAVNEGSYQSKRSEIETYLSELEVNFEKAMRDRDLLVKKAKERIEIDEEILHRYFDCLKYRISKREEESLTLFESMYLETKGVLELLK